LTAFFQFALEAVADRIAAVKPNIAFFEALGLGGLRALTSVAAMLREHRVPFILDGKRGDIGSTAEAYAAACLGETQALGRSLRFLEADALTVNPFLGFDTLEPFVAACRERGKGLFVLVRTSNPGAAALQGAQCETGSVSERVADWLAEEGAKLLGACGYSSLGAVVGATYPDEARALRRRMPHAFFLIPGMSAQGASAADAAAGFARKERAGGALINVSRGLLSSFSSTALSREELRRELQEKAGGFNRLVNEALAS